MNSATVPLYLLLLSCTLVSGVEETQKEGDLRSSLGNSGTPSAPLTHGPEKLSIKANIPESQPATWNTRTSNPNSSETGAPRLQPNSAQTQGVAIAAAEVQRAVHPDQPILEGGRKQEEAQRTLKSSLRPNPLGGSGPFATTIAEQNGDRGGQQNARLLSEEPELSKKQKDSVQASTSEGRGHVNSTSVLQSDASQGENLQHTASTHSPLLNSEEEHSPASPSLTRVRGEVNVSPGEQAKPVIQGQQISSNSSSQISDEQSNQGPGDTPETNSSTKAKAEKSTSPDQMPEQNQPPKVKRRRNYLHGVLPVVEVDSPPSRFPVTSPNVSDKDWFQYHVKGTPKLITMFSGECNEYFDWQTLGMFYSFKRSGQPGRILRLLACSTSNLANYKGLELCPTLVAPSWNINPRTGDHYSAINKPVGVQFWLEHGGETLDVDWVLILDADQIIRAPIIPWELGAEKGRILSVPYTYLIGCDNILAELHLHKNKKICDKVGGVLGMTIGDARLLAPWWINKTEEVRADTDHYATNITGDIYGRGWISEMYGYSYGASEVGLRHLVNEEVMLYPGYIPVERVDPRLLHYGLPVSVTYFANETKNLTKWSWAKFSYRSDVAFKCAEHFPDPPDVTLLPPDLSYQERRRDLLSIELVAVLNRALRENHRRIGCDPRYEEDVGIMDINGGGLAPSGAVWVDVWRGKASERLQAGIVPHFTRRMGIEERESAFEKNRVNKMLGNGHMEMVGVERGFYIERVSKDSPPHLTLPITAKRTLDSKPTIFNPPEAKVKASKASPLINVGVTSASVGGKPKQEWKEQRKTAIGGSRRGGHEGTEEEERRRSLFRSATAEKLFTDFGSGTSTGESSHMAMLLCLSMGLVVAAVMLFTATRMFCRRRRKVGKKAHRLKRDGVRKARLLDL